jgi:2'-5' RNA ligase
MSRLRTFIAVPLDKSIRDRLVTLQDKLAGSGAEVKWVEAENLHVTLLFLGEVDERELVPVCRAVTGGCQRLATFGLTAEHVGCFPNPRRPRTLWVGVGQGRQEVCELHDLLEPPLLELGCYRREDRPYTPHVTLGRVKSTRPQNELELMLGRLGKWQGGQMQAREVLVLSSELTPRGPIYSVLSRAKLAGE